MRLCRLMCAGTAVSVRRAAMHVRNMHASAAPAQEKNEALRAAAAAANKGGSVNEARLQDREQYISSLQARSCCKGYSPTQASPSGATCV